MYFEQKNRYREDWKFNYKGSDLERHARAKVEHFRALESRYRFEISQLLTDQSVSVKNGRREKLNKLLDHIAEQKEMCEVYLHEFHRTPDRDFTLSISDVVFFGLAGHEIAAIDSEN